MAHPARSKLSSEISAGLNSAAGTNAILSGRLLGETTFHVDGALVGISNRKSKSLLAYLCLSETGSESRERIVGTLWSEAEPDRARASLRQAIYEVRSHLLAAGFVGFDSDNLTVRLDTSRVSCDVQEILSALEAACVHPQLLRREQASSALLEDLDSTDPAFCTWLQSQRELLRRRLVLGLETCLAKPKAGGADRKQLAAALLNLDPAHELAVRALMRIYQEERNPGAALDVYKRLWDYLDREFDIEPCPETQSLAAGIKLADDDRAGAAPPSPKSQLEPGEKPAEKPARARAVLAVLTGERKPALRAHVREWISRRQPTARVIERPDGGLIVDVEKTSEAARLAFALVSEPGLAALKAQAGDLSLGLHFGAGDARDGDETAVALAKLSDADHVIASEAARERLVEGLDATIQDLGFLRIPETADRARAFMLGPAAVTLIGTEPALQKMQPTIAIVPMLPTDHGQSNHVIPVLAAEELSNELSRSQMVDVISPLSSRRLAGRELSPDEIGKRLGADYLVLGSFQESGRGGLLSVELVDARTNVMKWQQRTDLSSLSTENIKVAIERIAQECLSALFVAQLPYASAAPLATLDSYKLLFSAIALMDRWTRNSFHRAHEHLAILRQRAPLHHWPNAWLSAWHIRSISQGWSADAAADGKAAIEHAKLALDSNANCSLAIAMEGWANVYGSRRLDLAIERMQFAVEVNHSDSLAWLLKGITHAFIDQPKQAVEAVERALKLSPIDPRRSYYEALAAGAFACTDQHERTIELAQSSLRANRLHASPLRALATAQWYSGREEAARDTVRRLIELEPRFTVDGYLRQHPAADSRFGRRIADALRAAGAP